MSINEFAEAVRKELETRMGKPVEVREVLKNNGVILHGIIIVDMENNVLPTIYLDSYYENYDWEEDKDYIIDKILRIHEKSKVDGHMDMDFFTDFEKVKDKIAFKLINYERNLERLADVPYTRYLDLAKVYYITVKHEKFGTGTILVRNNHMKEWGVTVELLEELATKNTPRLSPICHSDLWNTVKHMVEGFSGEKVRPDISERMEEDNYMYILTNQQKLYGAATMCYENAIKTYAEELQSDIYILPSSTHEVILVPAICCSDVAYLRNMVRTVNRTQVADEEVLSDSVYVYSRETDSIAIA
uniref:DUF5688 family protein n=1 Tax=Acetatifactor sp. TaxID=1872090 RepID=UPI0040568960